MRDLSVPEQMEEELVALDKRFQGSDQASALIAGWDEDDDCLFAPAHTVIAILDQDGHVHILHATQSLFSDTIEGVVTDAIILEEGWD